DVIVFSDKASVYRDDERTIGWDRWYRRTVADSVKQLSGAHRILTQANSAIYVDEHASQALPFELPASAQRRIHLVAVARPELEDVARWPGLVFDSAASPAKPFRIGQLQVRDRPVHVFDALSMGTLLAELDTISDFVAYLYRREQVITRSISTTFHEFD